MAQPPDSREFQHPGIQEPQDYDGKYDDKIDDDMLRPLNACAQNRDINHRKVFSNRVELATRYSYNAHYYVI